MKIAFMFSGQGSQYLGMCKEFYDKYECVRRVFSQANSILGYQIEDVMFNDSEKLNNTLYTQTAMFVMYQSILKVLEENNIFSDYSFGLSLGEYGAYLHNEVFDFETGLKIIQKRAEAMNEATKNTSGKMSAILGMEASTLEKLIEKVEGYVKIANYNTYGQLVISGEAKAVEQLNQLALASGAKRALNLNTSGAFHSDLMLPAVEQFERDLDSFILKKPNKHLLINTSGDYFEKDILSVMIKQITNSVKFYQIVEKAIADGIDCFIEIGPKTTLSSFVRKVNRDVTILNIEDLKSLDKAKSVLEVN